MVADLTAAFQSLSISQWPSELFGLVASRLPTNRDKVRFLFRTSSAIRSKFGTVITSIESRALSDLVSTLATKATDAQWGAFLQRLTSTRHQPCELFLTLNCPESTALQRIRDLQACFVRVTKVVMPEAELSLESLTSLVSASAHLRKLACKAFAQDVSPQAFQNVAFPPTFEHLQLLEGSKQQSFDTAVIASAGELSIENHSLLLTTVAFDLINKKDPKAKELLQRAVCLMPNNVRALFLLSQFPPPDDASFTVRTLERVRQICPDYAPGLERLALHYYQDETTVLKGHRILSELAKLPNCRLDFLIKPIRDYLGLGPSKGLKNPKRAKEILQAAVRYSKFPQRFKAYLGDLLARGEPSVPRAPAQAKAFLEEAVDAGRQNMDGEQYLLCRRSLATLLQRGAPGIPPDPLRAKGLLKEVN